MSTVPTAVLSQLVHVKLASPAIADVSPFDASR